MSGVFLRSCFTLLPVFVLMLLGSALQAHEVRPAYLEITEQDGGHFQVIWKQPVRGDVRLPLEPILPAHCVQLSEPLPLVTGGAYLQTWTLDCQARGLTDGTIGVAGLEATLTDALVRVALANGEQSTRLLKGADYTFVWQGEESLPGWSYFVLGVEHLLFGFDHVLFVIGLIYFLRSWHLLWTTITSFTVAHSITLALATLGYMSLPQGPVEAVIALSILFLAVELWRDSDRQQSVVWRRPWLVAFTFGLLHGFGFAGALADIGLPRDTQALALFAFNIGVEAGQLLIVAAILGALMLLRRPLQTASPAVLGALMNGPVLIMGGISAFWLIDRTVSLL